MLTIKLRQVGGSTMIAIPPHLLQMLGLQDGDSVTIMGKNGWLVVEPRQRPRDTLAELLADSD